MENSNLYPRLKDFSLKQPEALTAFITPFLILGISINVNLISKYFNNPYDIWASEKLVKQHVALTFVFFFISLYMFYKQWFYYYVVGYGKNGFFVNTCGMFNYYEKFLDYILSFWGGLIIITSVFTPSYWLAITSVYFFFVFLRCRVTLQRVQYATQWLKMHAVQIPEHGRLDYPFKDLHKVAEQAGLFSKIENEENWEADCRVMIESLDWLHPRCPSETPEKRDMKSKEILSGWDWIDLRYGFGLFFGSIIYFNISYYYGPHLYSLLFLIISAVIFVICYSWLSKKSKRWGMQHWMKIVNNNNNEHIIKFIWLLIALILGCVVYALFS